MAKAFSILLSDPFGTDSETNSLATFRTLASEPFGGRYRLVDFILSSLVNSGIYRVGVLTKSHYGSLMDHLGWGKDWDLNRRDGGLQFLTPFIRENLDHNAKNNVDALISARTFIEDAKEETAILASGNLVANIDFRDVLSYHEKSDADITALYVKGRSMGKKPSAVKLEADGRVVNAVDGFTDYTSLRVFVFKKEVLLQLLDRAEAERWSDIQQDFVIRNLNDYRVYAYEQTGFCCSVNNVEEYYNANMALLDEKVREELFFGPYPVLTRVKNSAPTFYGFESKVENSLVADGCTIDGQLKNCIVFRDVVVEKGAVLENCILMQNTRVEADAKLTCVITDKDVQVKEGRVLSGYTSYPFVVEKGAVI